MPSGNKKVYEVKIGDLHFSLRSSHDERTVNKMVQLVNDKVQQAQASGVSYQNALTLAALHLAEEYFLLKTSTKAELQNLQKQTLEILSQIEKAPLEKEVEI